MDAVYMEAVQAVTGSGGWPMSVFLTPDRRPFYGGTYFPPVDRHGTPAFRTVLATLADAWAARRRDVEEQADEIFRVIESRTALPARAAGRPLVGESGSFEPPPDVLAAAVEDLAGRFDPEWGGFSPAPKFPQPTLVDLVLLDAARARTSSSGSQTMAVRTLDAMAAGGIHDHLGGGFARYSTDTEWLVPHFEKMLYDQAGLLRCYLHAWQVTGRRRLPRGGRGDRPVRGARPHPRSWGRLLGGGRRFRGERGCVLRLDADGTLRSVPRGRLLRRECRPGRRVLRGRRCPELRRPFRPPATSR